jgi:hypothetical protein
MKDRWTMTLNSGYKLLVEPNEPEMTSFIGKVSEELQQRLIEHEETMILSWISKPALEKLIEKCQQELKRRNGE